jgi:hypothetical protein
LKILKKGENDSSKYQGRSEERNMPQEAEGKKDVKREKRI